MAGIARVCLCLSFSTLAAGYCGENSACCIVLWRDGVLANSVFLAKYSLAILCNVASARFMDSQHQPTCLWPFAIYVGHSESASSIAAHTTTQCQTKDKGGR